MSNQHTETGRVYKHKDKSGRSTVKLKTKQIEKDESLKDKYNKLYNELKSGKISHNQFSEIIQILKEATNYDKLNIKTGIVFNDARTLLRHMGKVVDIKNLSFINADEKLEEVMAKAKEIIKFPVEELMTQGQIDWYIAERQIKQSIEIQQFISTYKNVKSLRSKKQIPNLAEDIKALPECNDYKRNIMTEELNRNIKSDEEIVIQEIENDAKQISNDIDKEQLIE